MGGALIKIFTASTLYPNTKEFIINRINRIQCYGCVQLKVKVFTEFLWHFNKLNVSTTDKQSAK